MSRKWNIFCLLLAFLLLTGCSLRTLDALYQVPKRSDEYNDLQAAIDRHLGDLEYWAPLSGSNLQAVQTADLDGDGHQEYLLFAKGTEEKPLNILIFRLENGAYVLSDTIQSYGLAFDAVEYAPIDDRPGYELVVGCRISDQVARSVRVYSFVSGKASALMDANYTRFLTYDITEDGKSELLVLRPGETEVDNGLAELYTYTQAGMERYEQVVMSEPADCLKQITAGTLHGGQPAVYAASAMGDDSVVTDVFAVVNGQFTNIRALNEVGSCISKLTNLDDYAEDMDGDGDTELPGLVEMRPPQDRELSNMQYLLRWYSVTAEGQEVDKLYTCHDLHTGWYLMLEGEWAGRVVMLQQGSSCEFYVWDETYTSAQKLMTVYYLVGNSREELASKHNRFILHEGSTALYAANLDASAAQYGITQERLIESFHLLAQDRKTKEVTK